VLQAQRVTAESRRRTPVALSTIIESDIPDCLDSGAALADHDRPGQYL